MKKCELMLSTRIAITSKVRKD